MLRVFLSARVDRFAPLTGGGVGRNGDTDADNEFPYDFSRPSGTG